MLMHRIGSSRVKDMVVVPAAAGAGYGAWERLRVGDMLLVWPTTDGQVSKSGQLLYEDVEMFIIRRVTEDVRFLKSDLADGDVEFIGDDWSGWSNRS